MVVFGGERRILPYTRESVTIPSSFVIENSIVGILLFDRRTERTSPETCDTSRGETLCIKTSVSTIEDTRIRPTSPLRSFRPLSPSGFGPPTADVDFSLGGKQRELFRKKSEISLDLKRPRDWLQSSLAEKIQAQKSQDDRTGSAAISMHEPTTRLESVRRALPSMSIRPLRSTHCAKLVGSPSCPSSAEAFLASSKASPPVLLIVEADERAKEAEIIRAFGNDLARELTSALQGQMLDPIYIVPVFLRPGHDIQVEVEKAVSQAKSLVPYGRWMMTQSKLKAFMDATECILKHLDTY